MPNVRTSTHLSDNYDEVSNFCHSQMTPVFITKNGHNDLAVMSMKAYEEGFARYELYSFIDEGLEAVKNGDSSNLDEFMDEFWKEVKENA